jgi:tetratricopeptide (TPR) repeat protein
MKPEHPHTLQAVSIFKVREQAAIVAALRNEAENHRQQEQWSDALNAYAEALALAPQALFAISGKEEAVKRLNIDTALEELIARPVLLQDEEQRDLAARLLDQANRLEPQGPRLRSQIEQVRALVQRANTDVTVTLASDNATEVTIYHVGRIGTFLTKEIELKPGRYTIIGTKRGYRDTRLIIEIDPGTHEQPITITCDEPI